MMFSQEEEVLNEICMITQTCPSNQEVYKTALDNLNPIVIGLAQDEEYRLQLGSCRKIWDVAKSALDGCPSQPFKDQRNHDICFLYMRTLRGIFLLLRNMSVSNQTIAQDILIQNSVIKSFINVTNGLYNYDDMETSLYIAACSFLHNINKEGAIFDPTTFDLNIQFLKYPLFHEGKQLELIYPYILLFLNLIQNDDFCYHLFRHDDIDLLLNQILIEDLAQNHSTLYQYLEEMHEGDDSHELPPLDIILLKVFCRIAANESFAPYFEKIEKTNSAVFFKFLKLMQLVVTSSESWDKYQLTVIMAWCFRIYDQTSSNVEQYFLEKVENESVAQSLHTKLNIVLDIISKLCQYEHVQKFLIFYKGLEKLITLFQVLQNNLIRINFHKENRGKINELKTTKPYGEKVTDTQLLHKRVDYTNNNIKSTNFPECKSLIVEILSMLTFNKKEIQNKIRELHGLELVLSNCVIDDNDPFIKERSIICIRFLLTENKENQDFVAKLEAKKAVQDEALSEAGYEVKIGPDGNVGLTQISEGPN